MLEYILFQSFSVSRFLGPVYSNTTRIIEALENIARELPTNSLTQSIPTISSYVIGKPITPRPEASSCVKSLLILLALLVILGGEVLVLFKLIAYRIDSDNTQATATAQANATFTATANVVADNPDPYPPTAGTLALYDPLNQPYKWDNSSDNSFGGACQ